MNGKKQSAWSRIRISRRRMLHYALAGAGGYIAGVFRPVSALGESKPMNDTFTISKQTGDIYFTYETLVTIRENLLEVLKQRGPGDDYAHLVSEIETGTPPMIFADSAHIGRWKLIHRNDKLTLETQQLQANMPIRRVYTAPLEWQDGRWKVLAVYIKIVKSKR